MDGSGNSKRPKLSGSEDSIAVIDRISTLPDSLLSHILSFLPTKYAVRTSILSTRWKYLWASITNLDFDDGTFVHYKLIEETDRKHTLFMLFVYRVLLLLKPHGMRKFRLKCKCVASHGNLHINDWISTAIDRGVEELDIKINSFYSPVLKDLLPLTLFNCNTLAVLKLDGRFKLNLSTPSVGLPSLKILHLHRVKYEDEECVRKLFRSCPVLEDLVIERYDEDGATTFNISSASLIRLKIYFAFHEQITRSVLQINTPALKYLDLKDTRSWRVSLTNMVSLVEANIDACIWSRLGDGDDDEQDDNLIIYDYILFKLLEGLSNAKFLSLSCNTMEALSFASQFVSPKFHNLIRLKVYFNNRSREWKPLSSLVANSVNLEELICR
ncbi:hypothetical protein LguiA_010770 [Lonicera macranthoides]